MHDFQAYSGPSSKLLISFDVGTTFSSVSYCILDPGRVPKILGVNKFPGQHITHGHHRIPSVLYYDEHGNLRAAGTEVLMKANVRAAQEKGWTKAERWKLHLCPKHLASSIDTKDGLPPLPTRKTVVDILADFIKHLFQCAKTYIEREERRHSFTWSSLEGSIEYIFTHPNSWEGTPQQLYRRAIVQAGLIPPEGQSRVHMLTEGEANLHFCGTDLLNSDTANQVGPHGVVIVDAGGGTVDLNMYSMTTYPVSCNEIAPAECRLQGSVFITQRARDLLQKKLKGWIHSDEDMDEFTREFDSELAVKSDQEPVYIKVAGRRYDNATYGIRHGKLRLSGEEATGLFDASIGAITTAFEQQERHATIPITVAFLVGGFSENGWLWSRLRLYFESKKVKIYRPGKYANKAVAHGAVLSHIDRENYMIASRVTRATCDVLSRELVSARNELDQVQQELRVAMSLQEEKYRTVDLLTHELTRSRDHADGLIQACEQKHQCETLYAQGRINDAVRLLLDILGSTSDTVKAHKVIAGWLQDFCCKCIMMLEKGSEVTRINDDDEMLVACYATALSIGPSNPTNLLSKWAKRVLRRCSVDEVMVSAAAFKLPAFDIHQAICDALEGGGRIAEAIKCLQLMQQKLSGDVSHDEQVHWQWILDFRQRCSHQLAKLGDAAMQSRRYHEAAEQFSTILSLDPVNRVEILIKRSKARLSAGSLEDALCDANEVIKSDPSSHLGYEQKYAALHAGKRYTEAVDAFHAMLATLEISPHMHIRELRTRHIDVTPIIQEALEKTVSNLPRVLIDTASGCLSDKAQQMAAFKRLPIYDELRSSMTTPLLLDCRRIEREVKVFYRYTMLSHRWEKHGEPCYQTAQDTSVYELQISSPNSKLQTFCKMAHGFGFHWAWSDTCCIDKNNLVVLHESLVAMFTWYRGSALTFVYLQDVSSQKPGALRESVWNERGWTYQEYVAAETVQFYTRDWKPYLGLDVFNHKESPTIIAEMEEVSQVSSKELATLRPGLDRVREKLFLASRRQTTLAEDAAYSLLGIFSATIQVRYGEGKCVAVGRLLEQVLTGSGDVTILAWTGPAGDYNSCLPPDLTAYKHLVPPHIPHLVDTRKMTEIVTTLKSSLSESDLTSVVRLYHRLNELPSPSLNSSRLQLPGLAFPVDRLTELNPMESNPHVYHGTVTALGNVEIKTIDDLSKMKRLLLFHPWICALLDQDFSDDDDNAVWVDDSARALRLVARLRQPFGPLLLAQVSRAQYRRVATDSLITVQVREDTLLSCLDKSITTVVIQ